MSPYRRRKPETEPQYQFLALHLETFLKRTRHSDRQLPSMQGKPLPTVTDEPPRDATFSEYGAGGPAFSQADLEKLDEPYGRRTLIQSLQWREAEGRRKMVRTREKYVHE